MKDYRRLTLKQTAYKIYTSILPEGLREEVGQKAILPSNQTEFRRGMVTMDNIYVLNYLINRQVMRGKKRMVIIFVDLKAAFDLVNREK